SCLRSTRDPFAVIAGFVRPARVAARVADDAGRRPGPAAVRRADVSADRLPDRRPRLLGLLPASGRCAHIRLPGLESVHLARVPGPDLPAGDAAAAAER